MQKELVSQVAQATALCAHIADMTALSGTMPRSLEVALELLTATRWILDHDDAPDVTNVVREVRHFINDRRPKWAASRVLDRTGAAKHVVQLVLTVLTRHQRTLDEDLSAGAQLVARDVAEGIFYEGRTLKEVISVLPREFPTDDAVLAAADVAEAFIGDTERFSEKSGRARAFDQTDSRLLARKLLVAYGCERSDMRAFFDGLEHQQRRREKTNKKKRHRSE